MRELSSFESRNCRTGLKFAANYSTHPKFFLTLEEGGRHTKSQKSNVPHSKKGRGGKRGEGWNFTWDGPAGLSHPPWEGGSPRANRSAKAGVRGFLEGSECPEADGLCESILTK